MTTQSISRNFFAISSIIGTTLIFSPIISGMSLWGAHRVSSLEGYSAMTILPTFESALECKHQLVLYEIIMHNNDNLLFLYISL